MEYPTEFLNQDRFSFETYEEWIQHRTDEDSKSRTNYEEIKELMEANWEHERFDRYKDWLNNQRIDKMNLGLTFITQLINQIGQVQYDQEMMKFEISQLKEKLNKEEKD